MKKFSKPFLVLLAAVMLGGLTGCGGGKTGPSMNAGESELFIDRSSESSSDSSRQSDSSAESSSNSSTESTAESAVINPIDVEMNGQLFSLPCKVSEIKNITIDRGFPFSVKQRDNGMYMSTSLFDYDDTQAGTIYLDGDCSNIADLSDETVIGIVAGDSRIPVSYKGLTFDSTKDDIARVLGEPVESSENYMYYYIEPEGSIMFSLDSESKITDIAVFLNIR